MFGLLRFVIACYFQLEILVRSLARMVCGAVLGYLAWHLVLFGWGSDRPLVFWGGLMLGALFFAPALQLCMHGLAGIVPRARGYNPGRAETAGLADLIKAGIVRRR